MNAIRTSSQRAAFLFFVAQALTVNAVTFTNDTFISTTDTNYEGAEIVVGNCTLTIDGSHSFSRLELLNGGQLTHSPAVPGLTLNVGGDVIIGAGSAANFDQKGFARGTGIGTGRSAGSPLSGSGGGYGGLGGRSAGGAQSGAAYGSVPTPAALGSGGGAGSGGAGGSGGGAIRLTVGGTIHLNGTISARGGDAERARSGGGSGGSLWISARSLSGSGAILADGGRGEPSEGGGGAGGRIAIAANSSAFTGQISARGGKGFNWGGAGSIAFMPTGQEPGSLVFDNGGNPGITPWIQPGQFAVTIRGGATVTYSIGDFSVADLQIAENCWLLTTNPIFRMVIQRNLTVDAGGGILADGRGYPGGQGLGAGRSSSSSFGTVGGGGGYGGYGGNGSISGASGGNYYGSHVGPLERGSGGGGTGQLGVGGAGGGLLQFTVGGVLVCNGLISANGEDGLAGAAGGGSGGSIWITTSMLSGAGLIRANGGAGSASGLYVGGGGSGGRIAIASSTDLFFGDVQAYGGEGAVGGAAGTIYTSVKGAVTSNRLLVDNRGRVGTNTAVAAFGSFDLVIRGGGRFTTGMTPTLTVGNLEIGSDSWLVIGRPGTSPVGATINVNNNARIEAGGGIAADGAGYPAGQGPGMGRGDSRSGGGGGGYGGRGGAGFPSGGFTTPPNTLGGNSYGSIISPREPGSGGASVSVSAPGSSSGAGGGSITLSVRGTLVLDGVLSANGNPGVGSGTGGGSGGTISLTVGTLAGKGLISANGGAGIDNGGGGGGGRIALSFGSSAFAGSWSAVGGAGYRAGGAGTVYVRQTNSNNPGQVLVDNGGLSGTNTPVSGSGFYNVNINVSGGASAVLTDQQGWLNSLHVAAGSTVILSNGVFTIARDAVVEEGATISADGTGRPSGQGSGAGRYDASVQAGGGGGYGGPGVRVGTNYGGGIYGFSLTSPREIGSGGASGPGSQTSGGAGGGAVLLTIRGALVVDGLISANGLPGSSAGAGGGSGGTVSLTAQYLSGKGRITANGGAGNGRGGGGGAGRIMIASPADMFAGRVDAYGGYGGGAWGGAGPIYFASRMGSGEVLLDNGGNTGIATQMESPTWFALRIQNGAVAAASYLTVSNLIVSKAGHLVGGGLQLYVKRDVVISEGGRISGDGGGFAANAGYGRGSVQDQVGSGGGHGGRGGASARTPGGEPYGSAELPSLAGSGGGAALVSGQPAVGSRGGGTLRLRVEGTLIVDGQITADGGDGLIDGAGGGAGGSVWISAESLAGSGLIAARGGAGEPFLAGGGGGGRIAINSPTQLFRGILSASGGAGFRPGETGTMFFSTNRIVSLVIIGQTPSGTVTQAVTSVDLIFNAPLDPSTVEYPYLSFFGPSGSITNVTLSLPEPARLRLSFPPQSAPGTYQVNVNSDIKSIQGERLLKPYTVTFTLLQPGMAVASRLSGNDLLLSWSGVVGASYQPIWSTNMVNWAAWGSPILCTNPTGSLDVQIPLDTAPKKFFKIVLAD